MKKPAWSSGCPMRPLRGTQWIESCLCREWPEQSLKPPSDENLELRNDRPWTNAGSPKHSRAKPSPASRRLCFRAPVAYLRPRCADWKWSRLFSMRIDQKIQVSATLANAGADLERLGRSSEVEIESAMQAFKKLATQADVVLRQAAAIVGRIEEE